MLPRSHRLTRPADFAAVVRRGRGGQAGRVADRLMVVHYRRSDAQHPPRVGFVVSKAVGVAVVRNRTKRRLRHLVAGELPRLPEGTDVVIRANPAAAEATTSDLARSVHRHLTKVIA